MSQTPRKKGFMKLLKQNKNGNFMMLDSQKMKQFYMSQDQGGNKILSNYPKTTTASPSKDQEQFFFKDRLKNQNKQNAFFQNQMPNTTKNQNQANQGMLMSINQQQNYMVERLGTAEVQRVVENNRYQEYGSQIMSNNQRGKKSKYHKFSGARGGSVQNNGRYRLNANLRQDQGREFATITATTGNTHQSISHQLHDESYVNNNQLISLMNMSTLDDASVSKQATAERKQNYLDSQGDQFRFNFINNNPIEKSEKQTNLTVSLNPKNNFDQTFNQFQNNRQNKDYDVITPVFNQKSPIVQNQWPQMNQNKNHNPQYNHPSQNNKANNQKIEQFEYQPELEQQQQQNNSYNQNQNFELSGKSLLMSSELSSSGNGDQNYSNLVLQQKKVIDINNHQNKDFVPNKIIISEIVDLKDEVHIANSPDKNIVSRLDQENQNILGGVGNIMQEDYQEQKFEQQETSKFERQNTTKSNMSTFAKPRKKNNQQIKQGFLKFRENMDKTIQGDSFLQFDKKKALEDFRAKQKSFKNEKEKNVDIVSHDLNKTIQSSRSKNLKHLTSINLKKHAYDYAGQQQDNSISDQESIGKNNMLKGTRAISQMNNNEQKINSQVLLESKSKLLEAYKFNPNHNANKLTPKPFNLNRRSSYSPPPPRDNSLNFRVPKVQVAPMVNGNSIAKINGEQITPEIAAQIVRNYILPMFSDKRMERRGTRFASKNKSPTQMKLDTLRSESVTKRRGSLSDPTQKSPEKQQNSKSTLKKYPQLSSQQTFMSKKQTSNILSGFGTVNIQNQSSQKNTVFSEIQLNQDLYEKLQHTYSVLQYTMEELETVQFQNEQLEHQNSKSQQDLSKKQVENMLLLQRLKVLKKNNDSLQVNFNNLTHQYETIKNLLITVEGKRIQVMQELVNVSSTKDKLADECHSKETENKLLDIQLSYIKHEFELIYDSIQQLSKYKMLQDQHEVAVDMLKKDVWKANQDRREAESQIVQYIEKNDQLVLDLKQIMDHSKEALQGKDLLIKQLREKVFKNEIQLKDSQENYQSLKNLNMMNESNLNRAIEEIQVLKKRIERLKVSKVKINQKICRYCNQEFIEIENFNWSCRTHQSEYGGEMWWCCGRKTKEAPGCKFSKHANKDDEDHEIQDSKEGHHNEQLRCFCCKQIGHSGTECEKDPNFKTIQGVSDLVAQVEIDDQRIHIAETELTNKKPMSYLDDFRKYVTVLIRQQQEELETFSLTNRKKSGKTGQNIQTRLLEFDDYNYTQINRELESGSELQRKGTSLGLKKGLIGKRTSGFTLDKMRSFRDRADDYQEEDSLDLNEDIGGFLDLPPDDVEQPNLLPEISFDLEKARQYQTKQLFEDIEKLKFDVQIKQNAFVEQNFINIMNYLPKRYTPASSNAKSSKAGSVRGGGQGGKSSYDKNGNMLSSQRQGLLHQNTMGGGAGDFGLSGSMMQSYSNILNQGGGGGMNNKSSGLDSSGGSPKGILINRNKGQGFSASQNQQNQIQRRQSILGGMDYNNSGTLQNHPQNGYASQKSFNSMINTQNPPTSTFQRSNSQNQAQKPTPNIKQQPVNTVTSSASNAGNNKLPKNDVRMENQNKIMHPAPSQTSLAQPQSISAAPSKQSQTMIQIKPMLQQSHQIQESRSKTPNGGSYTAVVGAMNATGEGLSRSDSSISDRTPSSLALNSNRDSASSTIAQLNIKVGQPVQHSLFSNINRRNSRMNKNLIQKIKP